MAFHPHLQPPRPEVRAFLDEVREHPDDDAPRLIYADWLLDQGDDAGRARAELIRVFAEEVVKQSAASSVPS